MKMNAATASLLLLAGAQAQAGGLWLNEYGDFSGGRAAAGAAAGTGDAAAIIYNPAGASGVESGELFVSAGVLIPSTEFDLESSSPFLGDNDGGSAGEIAPGAALAYVDDFGLDTWDFGISLGGMAGAGLDYNDDWVGRYQATEVELLIMALGTSIAWQATERLTLGVAPQFYYAELELDVNVPNLVNPGGPDNRTSLDGDDNGFGFMAGATYALSPQTRLGIAYQSELDIDFNGELKLRSGNIDDLKLVADSDTELTLAATVRASLHHDWSDRLGFDFTVGWDQWSELDNILVSIDATGGRGAGLKTDWDDTWHYAAGFQYKVNKHWDMTMGVAYDTNPVDKQDRTADLPVDRQVRVAVGTRYHHGDALEIGGYLNYADLGDAKIDARAFSGDYDGENSLLGISLFLNWRL
ncbi:MAG: hypothetical protein CME59_05005 [Halioglobus sp.]|nr:hypothetical protein [Halioglobus sp.]